MNQYTVSFTPEGESKPNWITGVLAIDVHDALRIGKGMYSKGGDPEGGTFEVQEDFL